MQPIILRGMMGFAVVPPVTKFLNWAGEFEQPFEAICNSTGVHCIDDWRFGRHEEGQMKSVLILTAAAIVPFGFVILAMAAAGGYVAVRVPAKRASRPAHAGCDRTPA